MTTAIRRSLAWLPGPLAAGLEDLLALWVLLVRTLRAIARGRLERRHVLEQLFLVGNQSTLFMIVTMGFIGAISVYQSGLQAQRLVPDYSFLGATFIKLLVRDVAASVGAMPLATRVGAGIAAAIGSMVVTEQVDALRMSAADPVEYLVAPRFVACVVGGSAVLIVAGGAALGAGVLTAQVAFGVNPRDFFNLAMVSWQDVVVGVAKCLVYGAAIAIVSAHRGLQTFGGSEGVGRATTRAVVGSSFAIIVLNLVVSSIAYVLLPG